MNPEDAEEYTEGLGQIVAGAKRQMEEGARLGVPQALGLSPTEWVSTRLGGLPDNNGSAEREQVTESAARNGAQTANQEQRKPLARLMSHVVKKPYPPRIKFRHSPRHWLLIPICGLLGLLPGLAWAASTPPSYKSQAAAFVSLTALPTDSPYHNDPFGGSQYALQRVQSYAQLATSPQVLQRAINDLHRGDGAELARSVNVTSSGGVMLWVTVEDRDPQVAAHLADAVIANLVRAVAAMESDGGQRAPVEIVPVQPAIVPDQPAGRDGLVKSLTGLVVGLLLGAAGFRFIRSRRIDTTESVVLATRKTSTDRDTASVVTLRVGDGRDFSRKVGR